MDVDLERLRSYYSRLSDEALAAQHAQGSQAFADVRVWLLVDELYNQRQNPMLEAASKPIVTIPPETPPPVDGGSSYNGVGGWLLFFCAVLTLFGPLLSTLQFLVVMFRVIADVDFNQYPGVLLILLIDTVLSIVLIAFSIYAGICLYQIRRGAVRVAKRYLQWYLGYKVVAPILPLMAGLPSEANAVVINTAFWRVAGGVLYFTLWYSYLNKSKRVRATYLQ